MKIPVFSDGDLLLSYFHFKLRVTAGAIYSVRPLDTRKSESIFTVRALMIHVRFSVAVLILDKLEFIIEFTLYRHIFRIFRISLYQIFRHNTEGCVYEKCHFYHGNREKLQEQICHKEHKANAHKEARQIVVSASAVHKSRYFFPETKSSKKHFYLTKQVFYIIIPTLFKLFK